MDYSPWPEREIWPFLKTTKRRKIFKTGEARSTKIGVHALHIHPYLHEFFEPILLIFYILKPMDYSPWPEREIGRFWKQPKRSKIFETGEARSTKIGIPVLYTHPYLHEFFEPVVS